MKKILIHIRHMQGTCFGENRVCHMAPTTVPENFGNSITGFGKWVLDSGLDATSDFVKGVEKAWQADGRNEKEKQRLLQSLGEFKRIMPKSIMDVIENGMKFETPSMDQLEQLIRLDRWVVAFEDANIFAGGPDVLSLKSGPMGVLKSLAIDKRKEVFFDFSQALIVPEVREDFETEYEAMFGDDADPKSDQVDQLVVSKDSAIATMKAVLGIEVPDDEDSDEYTLAKQALMHHYWRDGIREVEVDGDTVKLDMNTTVNPYVHEVGGVMVANGAIPGLLQDIQRGRNIESGVASVRDLEPKISPSLLKGAFRMGVIEPDDMPVLDAILNQRSIDQALSSQNVRSNTLKITKAVEREQGREMQKFSDILGNFSGIEWVAFLGFAYLAIRKAPKLALSLTGLYFAQKLLLKQENPIDDTWAPIVGGLTKKLTGLTKGPLQSLGVEFPNEPAGIAELQQRADIMSKFVSEKTLRDQEAAATGFALIGDMSLNQLSAYLDTGSAESRSILRGNDPNFRRMLSKTLRDRRLSSTAAKNFFENSDPDNLVQVSDPLLQEKYGTMVNKNLLAAGNTLAFVYYSIAAKNLSKGDERAKIVEAARRVSAGTYDVLPTAFPYNGKVYNAMELYMSLVREGMASAPNMTLSAYVATQVGIEVETELEATERIDRQLEAKKKALAAHEGGKMKFGIAREGASVKIGSVMDAPGWGNYLRSFVNLQATELNYPLRLGTEEFLVLTEEQIKQRWIENMKTLVDVAPPGPAGPLNEFHIKDVLDNSVTYEASLGDVGSSSLELFLKTPKNTLYTKFDVWIRTGKPVGTDPLQ